MFILFYQHYILGISLIQTNQMLLVSKTTNLGIELNRGALPLKSQALSLGMFVDLALSLEILMEAVTRSTFAKPMARSS